MSTILETVSSEVIEGVKFALNIAFLTATVLVWVGVWLEGKKFSEPVQEIGWKMLVMALGVEAIFGIAMLQLDSEIAGRQKVEVAQLTTQAANSSKLAEEAKERAAKSELELQKFRAIRRLTPEQAARVSEKMKPFAGIKFDGAWSGLDGEFDFLFTSIEDALIGAGLIPTSYIGQGLIFGRGSKAAVGMANAYGVVINVHESKTDQLRPAALALLVALTIEGVGVVFQPKVSFVSANEDAIHILIGGKT